MRYKVEELDNVNYSMRTKLKYGLALRPDKYEKCS